MAKGQHLTRHQQGIVKRYYDNADTIALQRLQEIVSDLYLGSDGAKADRLWKSAAGFLPKAGASPEQTTTILAGKNVAALAELVGRLGRAGGARG